MATMTDDLFGTADTGDSMPAANAPIPATNPATNPAKEPKPPTLYVINGNSRRVRCEGERCGKVMYWVPGRAFPMSADAPKCLPPNAPAHVRDAFLEAFPEFAGLLRDPADGLGVNHYTNCPDAAEFSTRKGTTGKRRGAGGSRGPGRG